MPYSSPGFRCVPSNLQDTTGVGGNDASTTPHRLPALDHILTQRMPSERERELNFASAKSLETPRSCKRMWAGICAVWRRAATLPHLDTFTLVPHPHQGPPTLAPHPHQGTPTLVPHPHQGTHILVPSFASGHAHTRTLFCIWPRPHLFCLSIWPHPHLFCLSIWAHPHLYPPAAPWPPTFVPPSLSHRLNTPTLIPPLHSYRLCAPTLAPACCATATHRDAAHMRHRLRVPHFDHAVAAAGDIAVGTIFRRELGYALDEVPVH